MKAAKENVRIKTVIESTIIDMFFVDRVLISYICINFTRIKVHSDVIL